MILKKRFFTKSTKFCAGFRLYLIRLYTDAYVMMEYIWRRNIRRRMLLGNSETEENSSNHGASNLNTPPSRNVFQNLPPPYPFNDVIINSAIPEYGKLTYLLTSAKNNICLIDLDVTNMPISK